MPKEIYAGKIADLDARITQMNKRDVALGYFRLIFFIVMVAAFIVLVQITAWFALISLLVMIAGFGKLIRHHEHLRKQMAFLNRVKRICRLEMRALEYDYQWNTTGKMYYDADHPYLGDLDIFGSHSIYQYINRAATLMGQSKLASWLSNKCDLDELGKRQQAVQELEIELDFRQNLAAQGLLVKDNPEHLEILFDWLASPNYLLGRKGVWIAKWILPLITVTSCGLITYMVSLTYAWIPLLVPAFLMYRTHQQISKINIQTEKSGEILSTYSLLFSEFENMTLKSDLLLELQSNLQQGLRPPSRMIAQLAYRINQLNVRQNFFGIFFNLFALWDFHWVVALEKSKMQIAPYLQAWFDAIGTVESLASLANLRFNNPNYTFPDLSPQTLTATGMGHPLIPDERRVNNDIRLKAEKHLMLITGSNMAGKSTFLRTVGVNLVLANAGGPVCAQTLSFDPRPIYTSMRVADDLEDGASSFYAELAKLSKVIHAVEKDSKVVFLLDEILKGTNSADRNKGSEALLLQLVENQGTGMVATHDLALTKLELDHAGHIENWYFDVLIDDDKLAFDYKIKRGICQSFNATLLMKKMGIKGL